MKKIKGRIRALIGAAVTAAMVMTAITPWSVAADGRKVVTLGADLNESQRNSILKYFGVLGKNVDTIYITNQDERNMLGGYISLEQIGTHTYSCAYVQPTTSGGIHVKTANLNYVTSNMIASALSTSGVKNCDVLAASPFEVSGTGALTGVLMAYEASMGSVLTESKKQAATQEITTTAKVAENVGQAQATKIVNDIKIKVIEKNVEATDKETIQKIVDEAVEKAVSEMAVTEVGDVETFSDEDITVLGALAETIAEQQYNFDDMRETLERVEQNVTEILAEEEAAAAAAQNNAEAEEAALEAAAAAKAAQEAEEELAGDSILMNTDDTALGEDVIIDATNQEAIQTYEDDMGQAAEDDEDPFEIVTEDSGDFDDGNDDAGQEAAPADTDEFDIGGTDEFGETDEYNGEADEFGEVDEYNGDDAGDDFGEVDEYNGGDAEADEFGETEETGEFGETGDFGETDEFGEQTDEFGETGEGDEFDDAGDLADGYAAEATFSADGGTPSFNSFAMKLYVNGDYVPASGTLKISDMDGNEVVSIDLSDSSNWGVRDAAAAYISVPGYDEANEIAIFTGDAGLYGSQYRVAGDVTFAQNDGGEALPGTETAPVHVESEFYYMPAGISVSGDGFKANSSATVSVELPEDAAAANVYTSDDEVATVDGGYLEGSGSVSMSLMESGDVTVVAEYLDAEGNVLGQDSVEITVF